MPGPERNKAMAEQGMVYDVRTDEYVKDPFGAERYLAWLESKAIGGMRAGLTRFDPSTNTRVPVTQEWVDEAVAEIVRLNQELTPMVGEYRADYSAPEQHQIDALNAECRMFLADHGLVPPLEADRIWEAVRAASAV